MTLPLLKQMPPSIDPQDCDAVVYTCLTAPACSADVGGIEVMYRRANGWEMEIKP